MKRNNGYLKDIIDDIKKTEEMILLHRTNGDLSIIIDQYEAIKTRQISELIESLPNDFELTPEMKAVLDERLREDEETYLSKEDSINRLNKKYGL